ncbi:unnamed protein product [Schistocephalus solidus]|uniref:Uncharacterized protein n=1 Tax=Schistocephalus solidus TaxID=70667 RepID=A0A183T950_SCHSO|nr:unnamed protein product [Schistocephalus solidus]
MSKALRINSANVQALPTCSRCKKIKLHQLLDQRTSFLPTPLQTLRLRPPPTPMITLQMPRRHQSSSPSSLPPSLNPVVDHSNDHHWHPFPASTVEANSKYPPPSTYTATASSTGNGDSIPVLDGRTRAWSTNTQQRLPPPLPTRIHKLNWPARPHVRPRERKPPRRRYTCSRRPTMPCMSGVLVQGSLHQGHATLRRERFPTD